MSELEVLWIDLNMFGLSVNFMIRNLCKSFLIGSIVGQSKCILIVKKSCIMNLVLFLFRFSSLQFNMLVDMTAVDYPNNVNRFEVVYNLLSMVNNMRVVIKVYLTALLYLPTLSNFVASSNWLEREIWDMFGVFFDGHLDLRRILTDYGFLGFPLRKEFPVTGFYELRYDDSVKMVVSEPLELAQELRVFYFVNS